ncbi:MAG: hypothetical protein MUE96_03640 [Bacteroidia bacterium]|jgi:hypothetical protein|nr:hypothetical protein [Bacteroidia bacterium]
MKTKRNYNDSLSKNIGIVMRIVRNHKGESADSVALVLGYRFASSYCKVERGEVHELNIETLLKFCEHFHVNLLTFMLMVELVGSGNLESTVPQLCMACSFTSQQDKVLLDHVIKHLPASARAC